MDRFPIINLLETKVPSGVLPKINYTPYDTEVNTLRPRIF